MRNKHTSRILSLCFFVVILITAVIYNISKPRVMILQSYHPDYAWTRDVDTGLHRIIDKWSDYSVTWHYMDTKKHSDPEWLRRAGIVARQAIKRTSPRVLIAVDDLAQSLAAKYFIDHPGMDIVFAGVNGSVEPYGYHRAGNVTGIYERKQLKAVQETIMAIESKKEQPNPHPRLVYILDSSTSLQKGRPFIDDYNWEPLVYTGSIVAGGMEDWENTILRKGEEADYIIVANYRQLPVAGSKTVYADPHTVMAWTDAHSKVPVIGINSFNVEDGAMLSIGVSPFEQGEVAAAMAEEILASGKKAATIPMKNSTQYIVAIRESSLAARRMELPAIYEAFGRATENFIPKQP